MYDYAPYDYTSNLTGTSDALAAIGTGATLVGGAISLLLIISIWKIYKKAGKPGWATLIPVYNMIVLLEIAELPLWYLLLLLVPFANIYVAFKTYIELAHKFGKSTGFGVATVFFGAICFPILAFSKSAVYKDNSDHSTNNITSNPETFQSNMQTPNINNINYSNPNNINEVVNNSNSIQNITPIGNTQNNMNNFVQEVTPTTTQQPKINNISPVMNQQEPQYQQPTPVAAPQPEINSIPPVMNQQEPQYQQPTPVSAQPEINSIPPVMNQQEPQYQQPTPVSAQPEINSIPSVINSQESQYQQNNQNM